MHADREALFARTIALVHEHRAASVVLLQRHLGVSHDTAETLLLRMATETTAVRRMQNGLFLYTQGPIGEELAALHGFARAVLTALAEDNVDTELLRAAAVRFGLAKGEALPLTLQGRFPP
ncbi:MULTISPECIES: hypothetical protein [unclassified Cupriavidus]|uniref:hypothetical protein n=1 Tax=unclassified Cupriavidus TaxID=2640874 RepID=UPI0010F7F85E|nr:MULTISPECIES: hypothetical protein [unclassified Cupriavidus]MWL92028.1 hypothetical protein [Cupriavidus sp. SW-Y-13]